MAFFKAIKIRRSYAVQSCSSAGKYLGFTGLHLLYCSSRWCWTSSDYSAQLLASLSLKAQLQALLGLVPCSNLRNKFYHLMMSSSEALSSMLSVSAIRCHDWVAPLHIRAHGGCIYTRHNPLSEASSRNITPPLEIYSRVAKVRSGNSAQMSAIFLPLLHAIHHIILCRQCEAAQHAILLLTTPYLRCQRSRTSTALYWSSPWHH